MRIQNNIAAMNAHRVMGSNNTATSKSLEKLSSGYRINRAGDDAAGLAISEKMRSQIKGLETASKNANDGISLVQTAEGALTEVHSMLNRMTELATQSANGTYDDGVDRENLQKEVSALKTEIDRISESTNYNGINLLDGSIGGGTASAAKAVKITNATTTTSTATAGKYDIDAITSDIDGATEKDGSSFNYTVTYKDNADGTNKTLDIKLSLATKEDGTKVLISNSGKEHATADGATAATTDIAAAVKAELSNSVLADKFKITEAGGAFTFEAREKGSAGAVLTGVSERTTVSAGTVVDVAKTTTLTTQAADEYKQLAVGGITPYTGTNADKATFDINGKKFVLATAATDVSSLDKNVTVLSGAAFVAEHASIISQKTGLNVTQAAGTLTFKPGTDVVGSGGLDLQIGDTSDNFNKLKVSVNSTSTKALNIASIDISTQDGASAAVSVIKEAINTVSSTRGDLGAIQNRLEHTINNLGVAQENMTAAESRIRDVDMAKEMMNFTKNNILIQASQSMLAQANQLPQGVLQLLR